MISSDFECAGTLAELAISVEANPWRQGFPRRFPRIPLRPPDPNAKMAGGRRESVSVLIAITPGDSLTASARPTAQTGLGADDRTHQYRSP
jgi:hypothetical protein